MGYNKRTQINKKHGGRDLHSGGVGGCTPQ